MITKTYQATRYQTYDMYVMLNGQRVLIPFRGGSLRPPFNGTFQTSDPELQAVLAKDTSLGITFKEIGSFDDESAPEDEIKDETVVTGVTTVQAAREYLISHIEGTSQSSLPNRTAVLALAEKHNYSFPDLK